VALLVDQRDNASPSSESDGLTEHDFSDKKHNSKGEANSASAVTSLIRKSQFVAENVPASSATDNVIAAVGRELSSSILKGIVQPAGAIPASDQRWYHQSLERRIAAADAIAAIYSTVDPYTCTVAAAAALRAARVLRTRYYTSLYIHTLNTLSGLHTLSSNNAALIATISCEGDCDTLAERQRLLGNMMAALLSVSITSSSASSSSAGIAEGDRRALRLLMSLLRTWGYSKHGSIEHALEASASLHSSSSTANTPTDSDSNGGSDGDGAARTFQSSSWRQLMEVAADRHFIEEVVEMLFVDIDIETDVDSSKGGSREQEQLTRNLIEMLIKSTAVSAVDKIKVQEAMLSHAIQISESN
jgi:hypothetical protein